MKNTIILFLLTFCTIQLSAQDKLNCKPLQKGFFSYDSEGETVYIYRKGNKQYEWGADNSYLASGTVRWELNCTYFLELEDLVVLEYPGEFKSILSEEQLDSVFNLVLIKMKETETKCEILNIEGKSFSVYFDSYDGEKTEILEVIPKKEGKKKFKEIQKAVARFKRENEVENN